MSDSLFKRIRRSYGARRDFSRNATVEETVNYSPGKEMGGASVLVGTLFRGAAITAGIFGLMYLLYEAVGLYSAASDSRYYSLSFAYMFFVTLVFSLLCAAVPYNKITKIAIPAGGAAVVIGLAALHGNPFRLFENSARYTVNGIIEGFVNKGFFSFGEFRLSNTYSFDEKTLLRWSVILFVLIFSVLFYFAISRKTNLVIFILTLSVIVIPIFSYNISRANLGFAFVIASIAGFITMRIVEYRYCGRYAKRLKKRSLRSGLRLERRDERAKRKIERLKLKNVADAVYEKAIDVEMGSRRAAKARRAVYSKARQEKKLEKKLERKRLREEKKLAKEAEKAKSSLTEEEKKFLSEEKRSEKAERSELMKKNKAAAGFTGLAAVVIAVFATLLPFAVVSKPLNTIGFIERGAKKVRAYVTDILVGDDVDLQKYPYRNYEIFGYETLSFEPRSYKNTQIFRVEAPNSRPVLMKSRTAESFDLDTDTWIFPSTEEVLDIRRDFGKNFSSDVITRNAYAVLHPVSAGTPNRQGIIGLRGYGFFVEQVHVMRANGQSKLLFIPSVMNSELGLRQYSSFDEAKDRYSAFYDGIYTSNHYGVDTGGYSTVSYIYDMRNADMATVLESGKESLSLVYSLALREKAGESPRSLLEEYIEKTGDSSFNSVGFRYFAQMTAKEREDFISNEELEKKYREFAYGKYTKTSGSYRIASLADELFKTADEECEGGATRFDKVLAVIKYLSGNDFYYTLTPKAPEGLEGSVLEAFLFDTKSGYCSHYATAAAMLLREAGIPARYAEGYRVAEWYTAFGMGTADRYRSDVRDLHSHTWIEVYFDEIGWIPFEVTKTMNDDYYVFDKEKAASYIVEGNDSGISKPDVKAPTVNETKDSFAASDLMPEWLEKATFWQRAGRVAVVAAPILAFIALICIVIILIRKRAEKACGKRRDMIFSAKSEDRYADPKSDNRDLAKDLIDDLLTILQKTGIGPRTGEQPCEFGERLNREYRGMSNVDPEEVMRSVVKEEFGHGLTYTELAQLAEYLNDSIHSVYRGLSLKDKIKFRYFKRII
ncbi:MAG: hypothetical protein IJT70_03160 [Clostridia bacterium]|nr:hypothetical protein [Clostridia bacterium]